MIRVRFDPNALAGQDSEWWLAWETKAQQAFLDLESEVAAGRPPKFKTAVWHDLKAWMFERVFHGKCAYCEGRTTPQSFGDGEHWRPKGAVSYRVNQTVVPVSNGSEAHPGYWWLAYDWRNLLPACQRCNSGRGKNTQFPVSGSHVFDRLQAQYPDELDDFERPLLLHPFRGPAPEEHVTFTDFGQAVPVAASRTGEASIATFDLNRDALRDARLARMRESEDALRLQVLSLLTDGTGDDDRAATWVGPEAPYSSAVRAYLGRRERRLIADLRQGASGLS